MAEVKCIACNKMNVAGDRFCAACGSSLDLKLCAACEAINNPVADNCHSCGKPLPAAEAPVTPVFEVSEAPFYPPQRRQRQRQVYDARPSLVMRLNRAAKMTTLVVLPVAAIGLWGWQFYGQKLLQTVSPWVKVPAAQVQTKVAPAAAAVVGALPVVTEAPKAKPAAAEPKRPPKASAAPVVRVAPALQAPAVESAKRAAVVAPAASPAPPTIVEKPTVAETPASATAAQSAARSRVTHTRETLGEAPAAPSASSTPVADAPAPPAPPLTGGSASCPQAAAVLGLCSPNTQKGGS